MNIRQGAYRRPVVHHLPPKQTKAFGFFERAANMKQDGDSLFNAAHCLARGIGTDQDVERFVSAGFRNISINSSYIAQTYVWFGC